MKKFLFIVFQLCFLASFAQHTIRFSAKNAEDKSSLNGASVRIENLNRTAIADSKGVVVSTNVPAGNFTAQFSFVGLAEKKIEFTSPQEILLEVFLEAGEEEEEDEVIVTSTRISRSISDIPTRIETISGEELEEKGNMKPGDIRMLLNESTGIQTQQTSATSYNSSIRIQGLDGRYTQLLRDGFPLYAGFSGGLSLMQIAPLDLKRIEVIKGSSSTLYGGGAIAGLVNLISKTPQDERELSFMGNATSAGGLDLSGLYSQKFGTVGTTVFLSRNSAKAFDPADIGLTAIPKFERYTIHPRLFFYGKKTTADLGVSYITEDRLGGSINYIKNGTAEYFEKNNTDRITAQAQLLHSFNRNSSLQLKTGFTKFNRTIEIPNYVFDGLQNSTFHELNYRVNRGKADWVAGLNLITDQFSEKLKTTSPLRDYNYTTYGAFIQNNFDFNEKFSSEIGLRGDYTDRFGFALLPRIALLYKFSPALSARAGGGLGYKTPTMFTEETERINFRNLSPLNTAILNNERSAGGSVDVNYRIRIGEVGVSINQLFFYTKVDKPLFLGQAGGTYSLQNSIGYISTKGVETNLRFTYDDFKLFIGYTHADVNTVVNGKREWFPLTAKHRLNNVLMYEKEESLKLGFEAYYFSRQKLSDGVGKSYWILGFMAEKMWKRFSLFINFENLTDTRQTRFDTVFTGTLTSPAFRDIYAPVDGFVVNGGLKLRL